MAIYNIKNYGSGKYLNITGDYLTSLTNNQNVMQWSGSYTPEQTWVIDTIDTSSTSTGVHIKSYVNQEFTLNIYRTTKNCDVYPSASNGGGDDRVYFVPVANVANGYKIITKSDFSTTKHYLSLSTNNTTNGTNVCWEPADGTNYQIWVLEPMKYMKVNANLHYVRLTPSEANIRYINDDKTSPEDDNYFNAGFFGDYESGTLPNANLVCEFNQNEISAENKNDLLGWNCTISNNKLYKDCNDGPVFSNASTFYIDSSNKAYIAQSNTVNTGWKCAVSGAPIMIDGVRKTLTEIKEQKWDGSWVYATWHGCLAVATSSTTGASEFFYVAMKTTSGDCTNGEAYNILNNLNLGIRNAIMLDGGSSFIFKYLGTIRANTGGTATINNIMYF